MGFGFILIVAILIFVILIVKYLGVFAYDYNSPKIKGAKGEYSVSRLLQKLNSNEYKTFNDIYIKVDKKSTQIDHLIISKYGIFVIETKTYDGWIHGREKSEYWTQTFYTSKEKFRNPVKQNWAHIFFLKEILSNFKQVKYHSIIVFAGDAELKNIHSEIPVVYEHELLETIKKNTTPRLSIDQIEDIVNQLNKFIVTDKKEKNQHNTYVTRNIEERRKNVKQLICPNCKGELVIRKGRYGEFYGCSNFPKCKFSKKPN
ncbi:MAG: hypothetical protein COA58_11435 [Bacteroidetes bacterium]|nr:MAG: hypothetical protein COA58_11435 [Bacteroidota bacterium]